MPISEDAISQWVDVFQQVLEAAGSVENTKIIPNLEVIDDSPASLPAGYIIVRNDQGFYGPVLTVPGIVYTTGDFVNVILIKGTEPIAFQQGSASGGTNTGAPADATYLVLSANPLLTNKRIFTPGTGFAATDGGAGAAYTLNNRAYQLWESDAGALVIEVDAAGNVVFNAAQLDRDVTINWDTGTSLFIEGSTGYVYIGGNRLVKLADTDTYIDLAAADELHFYAGGVLFLSLLEAAQDVFVVNPGELDIDFNVNWDNGGAIGVDGATGNVDINQSERDCDTTIHWDLGTALAVDGATGVVSFGQPARAARIYNSAVQAITTAVNTKITFDTIRRNDGGLADLTNDRLTAVVAGWYIITAGFGFAANAVGNRGGELMVNGTIEIAQQFYAAPAAGVSVMSISAVYYLAAGDYVELFGFQTSGGNLNTLQAGNKCPELAMALLK